MANVFRYPYEPMGPGFFIFFRHEYYGGPHDAADGGANAGSRNQAKIQAENDNVMEIIKQGFPAMLKKIIE